MSLYCSREEVALRGQLAGPLQVDSFVLHFFPGGHPECSVTEHFFGIWEVWILWRLDPKNLGAGIGVVAPETGAAAPPGKRTDHSPVWERKEWTEPK